MRILIAEDEPLLNEALKEYLEFLGHSVYSFNNGLSAKEFIVENSDIIDLIITDHNMPKMKGAELGQFLLDSGSKIKRVCYSSDVTNNGFKTYLFDECISKGMIYGLTNYLERLAA